MDNWLEQHIEKHLTFKGYAIMVTDKGERIYHINKDGLKVPFEVEIDLFNADPDILNEYGITISYL